jgi:hypothetical protein
METSRNKRTRRRCLLNPYIPHLMGKHALIIRSSTLIYSFYVWHISPGTLHKHCTLRKSFELLKIPCVAMFSRYNIISLETLALASSPPRLCKRPQEIAPKKAAVHEWHLCSILLWAWLCSCTDQQTQHWGQRAKTRYALCSVGEAILMIVVLHLCNTVHIAWWCAPIAFYSFPFKLTSIVFLISTDLLTVRKMWYCLDIICDFCSITSTGQAAKQWT